MSVEQDPAGRLRLAAAGGLKPPDRTRGVVLTLIGAALFSTKAVFIKLAYVYEVAPIELLGLRMAISLPFFLAVGAVHMRRIKPDVDMDARAVLLAVLIGLVGYYVASFTDFAGLRYVSAGMERIILFIYPTMVLIAQRVFFGTRTTTMQWVATALSYAGIVLAFSQGDTSAGSRFYRGAALVLVSAATYSVYVIGSGRMTPRYGTIRFTTVAMVAAAIGVLAHVYLSGHSLAGLATPVYGWSVVIAIVCTVIPTYLVADGIKHAGAGDAAIIGAIGPVVTIGLEYYALPDRLTPLQLVGGAMVVAGVVLAARSKPSRAPGA